MQKIFKILIITLFLNFFMLSFGYGQDNGVSVMGVVPATELNTNVGKIIISQEEDKSVYKENKYLYFFEKALGLSQTSADSEIILAQTKYDLVFSKLLLWGLLFITAIILWFILRFIDKLWSLWFHKRHVKKVHAHV